MSALTGTRVRSERRASGRSEEHTSELQSLAYLVCRLLLEKKKQQYPCISLSPALRSLNNFWKSFERRVDLATVLIDNSILDSHAPSDICVLCLVELHESDD